jgi:DNA-binding transcriptional LysR family regulator
MSTGLKQLEEILGVMLVHRGSRFVGFTPEGERALDWARRIVSDTRAMRQDINSFKGNLSGELRIAAIPTVLGMVASLTTPFRARHPDVRFRVVSCTSSDVLGLLENLEVDAGLTYIENEPVGKVRTIPLYRESYRLLTAPDGQFGDRRSVTWKEVGQVPLCLLTPDMQNRRIIDRALRGRDGGVAYTDFKFDHRSLYACEDRAVVERHAGQTRRHPRTVRRGARNSDCRAEGRLQHPDWLSRPAIH